MSCPRCKHYLPWPVASKDEGDTVTVPCCGTTWELNADNSGELFWENTIDGEFELRADTTGETRTDTHGGPLTESENGCSVAAVASENVGPKVVHCKREKYDVYIGRPGKWGNPFKLEPGARREMVIAQYRSWLLQRPELVADAKRELRGKVLGCWCAPKPCHGDVLLEIANSAPEPTR